MKDPVSAGYRGLFVCIVGRDDLIAPECRLCDAPQGLFSFPQKKIDEKKAPKGETTIVSPFGIPHSGGDFYRLEACVFTADTLCDYNAEEYLPRLLEVAIPGF